MNLFAYCIFNDKNNIEHRMGAWVNNKVVDLAFLYSKQFINNKVKNVFSANYINDFMSLDKSEQLLVKEEICNYKGNEGIYTIDEVQFSLPVKVGGFTDFYVSKHHATNVGKLFRPDNPLMPNWLHMPIGYNGRASSIIASGGLIKRPKGQILPQKDALNPIYDFSRKLDFEVELGIVIGKNSKLGEAINIKNASDHIFGVCIVNDWSARDIQQWEYQPLGPFNSKSFATSISNFIVPIEEFERFKCNNQEQVLPLCEYLVEDKPYTYDINLEVLIRTKDNNSATISKTNFKNAYWTINQWISQHTVTGCNLQVGDIIASGTLSGSTEDSLGCLLEITKGGKEPLKISDTEERLFLENGDEIIINGYCKDSHGCYNIGSVSGKIV